MDDAGTYALSSFAYLRLLALVYLVAFVSLAVQVRGLAGRNGILPASALRVRRGHGAFGAFLRLPTLSRWFASDAALLVQCALGALLAVVCLGGFAPVPALLAMWLLYLSLTNACSVFLGYQWDALLVEMGLLAILLAPPFAHSTLDAVYAPPPLARWLHVWLLFRLVFSSGVVKLRSGDPTWRSLTALRHHYETQPLPNPLSWHVHQLRPAVHTASAAGMFAVELGAPLLLFGPDPLPWVGAAAIAALMIAIQATGNYGFFNVQTIALCVLVLDDATLTRLVEPFAALAGGAAVPAPADAAGAAIPTLDTVGAPGWWHAVVVVVGTALFALSLVPVARLFVRDSLLPHPVGDVMRRTAPFRIVNPYGLFAVMTTSRPEIVIEGSLDGTHWRAYEFRWKAGHPKRAPRFAAPYQPRLDWQMWFAALGTMHASPWFAALLVRLLEGSRDVVALLGHDPFDGRPPRYVRALLYDYRFTSRAERKASGDWWSRELLGLYCPAVELDDLK